MRGEFSSINESDKQPFLLLVSCHSFFVAVLVFSSRHFLIRSNEHLCTGDFILYHFTAFSHPLYHRQWKGSLICRPFAAKDSGAHGRYTLDFHHHRRQNSECARFSAMPAYDLQWGGWRQKKNFLMSVTNGAIHNTTDHSRSQNRLINTLDEK